MHQRHRARRDARFLRARHISQALLLGSGAVVGLGVGMMAHGAPTTSSTTSSTTPPPSTTTSTTLGQHHSTTTTQWVPPTYTTSTTQCYTNASGHFLGCW